jgi:hypothetical protein
MVLGSLETTSAAYRVVTVKLGGPIPKWRLAAAVVASGPTATMATTMWADWPDMMLRRGRHPGTLRRNVIGQRLTASTRALA